MVCSSQSSAMSSRAVGRVSCRSFRVGLFAAASVAMAAALLPSYAAAQATQPSLLQQLNNETQELYTHTQQSIAQVQLPPPRWLAQLTDGDDHPVRKWGKQLDPDVQRKLTEPRQRVDAVVLPSTRPAEPVPDGNTQQSEGQSDDADGGWRMSTAPDGREVTLESTVKQGDASVLLITPRPRAQQGVGLKIETRATSGFAPNNIAIILDEQGHLLVPIYLEREQLSGPVPVSFGDGQVTTATFIGSDRQTSLTVFRTERPIGQPARLGSGGPPADGSLVMILSPSNDSARLSVWTGGAHEWGVVVSTDGRIVGLARHDQFLDAALAMPVIRQLIDKGRVDRPQLGMIVQQVPPEDPIRQTVLGKRPAMRVQEVLRGSPAEAAGLRRDDLILELRDHPVGDVPSLAAVLSTQSGATPLTILRGGETKTIIVELDRRAE